MQPLQNVEVASQMAREHEASLTRHAHLAAGSRTASPARRWLGRQLVRTGLWLATDLPMRAAAAR